ncbi:uncharacterized protein LOC102567121 isoform X2 [Alligator mississippiensis]|uniref:uncharacterized protein LOC102567121 isoform X2 n=1 Tax=Alligator mississippiensis TaxID=8496 RepID=UPI0028775A02|nr:uncharacterized protein LOC102567121 isoform X2 [Alligator mississippiensis]
MEASLTCAVCLSLFEEPVTLPLCSHNFCRGCVLECLASAEGPPPTARVPGPGPARGPRCAEEGAARVACPLCRKPCPLPRGGAAALPVNTTLAEVVKLYRAEAEREPGRGEEAARALGGACRKHPARPLQLYCRLCCQAGCGQCVSELHQGIFHCVNLLDTVYQEEKLTFFSSLKKVRAINEKLEKEISSHQKAAEMMLNNEAEIITMEFEEIFKNLEMKKKQLLEDLENQRSKKEKELQIWKKMKGIHKITIENFLKDCEKLVDECDPQCFLEVACGLNKRMKTQLDLMHIASSYEKEPEYTRKQMDIKSVVKEILALQLTPVEHCIVKADLPSGGNESLPGNFVFKNSVKHWKDQKTIHKTFYELRYKYYMGHRKTSDQVKMPTAHINKKHKFVIGSLKSASSAVSHFCSSAKVKDMGIMKTEKLEREKAFDNTSVSKSCSQGFSIPPMNRDFPVVSSDLKLLNGTGSQEVSKHPPPSDESKSSVARDKVQVPQSSEKQTCFSTAPSLLQLATASDTTSNSTERLPLSSFVLGSADDLLPKFNKAVATVPFQKANRESAFPTFYLGNCNTQIKMDNQEGNKDTKLSLTKAKDSATSASHNLGSADVGKPFFSFTFGNSEDFFTVSKLSSSSKASPFSSCFNEKPAEQSTVLQTGTENNSSANKTVEPKWLKSPTLFSWEQTTFNTPEVTTTCITSSVARGKNDGSKTPPPFGDDIFSFSNNCPLECKSSPLFTFGSTVKSSPDSVASSSMLFLSHKNKDESEKIKLGSDKTCPDEEAPMPPVCKLAVSELSPKGSSTFFSLDISVKTEEAVAKQNALCSSPTVNPLFTTDLSVKGGKTCSIPGAAATQSQMELKVADDSSVVVANKCKSHQDLGEFSRKKDELETLLLQNTAHLAPITAPLAVEKGGDAPNDAFSDTEELSQASISSDCSSASEYFSVAEDKISASRKSGMCNRE